MSDDIREAVAAAVEQHSSGGEGETVVDAPVDAPDVAPQAPEPAGSEPTGADRVRDEKGRFAETPKTPPAVAGAPEGAAPAVTQAALRRAPQSWKKEYWEHFQKLDPQVQDYIEQREREAANGVSQYRTKAESLAAIEQAVAPFLPDLQRHGIPPAQWIGSLGNVHKTLIDPNVPDAQKLAIFAKCAQDYRVPIQYLNNPEVWQQLQPQQPQVDTRAAVRAELQEIEGEKQVSAFLADVQEGKYPHFEEVQEQMDGLLRSGLANDLPTAYKMACRTRDDLFDAELQRREQARQEEAKQAALKAKAAAVSVRSSAPTGPVSDAGKPRDIRSTVAAAWDQHAGGRL